MRFWGGRFLLVTLVVAACGTSAPVSEAPEPPPSGLEAETDFPCEEEDDVCGSATGDVAVLGCSNTVQAAQGYTDASAVDALVFGEGIDGITLRGWSQGNSPGWEIYDQLEPAGGYTAAWFMMCLFNTEHDGSMSGFHQDQVTAVVDNIRARSGNIPVYLSPLNSFEPGHVCSLTGLGGVEVAAAIADWGASNLPNVLRGPDTGPLSPSQLVSDGCHLNTAGVAFVGQQLVAFFDS